MGRSTSRRENSMDVIPLCGRRRIASRGAGGEGEGTIIILINASAGYSLCIGKQLSLLL